MSCHSIHGAVKDGSWCGCMVKLQFMLHAVDQHQHPLSFYADALSSPCLTTLIPKVKDSDYSNAGGSAMLNELLAQLQRYKTCAAAYQAHYHLPTAPQIAAVFAHSSSSIDAGTRAAVVAAGFLCVELGKIKDREQIIGTALPASTSASASGAACYPPRSAFYGHAAGEADGDAAIPSYGCQAIDFKTPILSSPPPLPPRSVVVVDQGMLAVLVADIWALSVADMAAAGIAKMTLLNSPLSVAEPEGILRFVRPWKRYLGECKLYACALAVIEFEKFLALRGNDVEHRNWRTIIETGRLQVVEEEGDDGGDGNGSGDGRGGFKNADVGARKRLRAAVYAVCDAQDAPISTAPTICAAVDLDATAFMDQQG